MELAAEELCGERARGASTASRKEVKVAFWLPGASHVKPWASGKTGVRVSFHTSVSTAENRPLPTPVTYHTTERLSARRR